MRTIRLRDGVREARSVLADGRRLMRGALLATLVLGFVFAILPALLKGYLVVSAQGLKLQRWSAWIEQLMRGGERSQGLSEMIALTLQQTGSRDLWVMLLDFAKSLILTPLLLSSLALLYNGFILRRKGLAGLEAVRTAGKSVKDLIIVALACMLAEWLVQMVPSVASGILSLLAEMLSWIPILGTIAQWLAVVLSLLITMLTDFAVIVIFCYVWIVAVCEGVSGFGALVRSWQLTRNAMHLTIASLLGLILLRMLAVVLLSILWLFAGRAVGIPLAALVYVVYAISGIFTVCIGAVTSALYQRRPVASGPRPGQFGPGGRDYANLKRANVD